MQYTVSEAYPYCVQGMWAKFHEIFYLVTLSREPSMNMCPIMSHDMRVKVLNVVN
jgi:hypothetical protein